MNKKNAFGRRWARGRTYFKPHLSLFGVCLWLSLSLSVFAFVCLCLCLSLPLCVFACRRATRWTFLQTTFMARRQLYGSSFKTVRRTFTFDFITSKLGCCQHAKLSIGYHQVFAFDTFKVIHLFSQTKVYQAAVVWRWWNGRWKQRWLASPQRCPPPLHTLLAAGRFKWMIFWRLFMPLRG